MLLKMTIFFTLQNQLRNRLSTSNSARNNEIINNARILSDKLNSVSSELLSIQPELQKLNVIQLNELNGKILIVFFWLSF